MRLGGTGAEGPIRVLHITSEVAPFSKTGGLGDVLGALPVQQRARGIRAHVVTPLYGCIDRQALVRENSSWSTRLNGQAFLADLWRSPDGHITFLDVPGLLDRDELYGPPGCAYDDNPLRFGVFARFAATMAVDYDVVHLHDWQAALAATYIGGRRPTVMTIHNLAFQGLCGMEWADRLNIPESLRTYEGVEYYGRMSFLKSGLTLANLLTTVSPTYAREIQSEPNGMGLAGLFQHRQNSLVGILNGIDTVAWDPETDTELEANYSIRDMDGRSACKSALRAELGLDTGPLFAVVSRASEQKGLDLIAKVAPLLVEQGARFAVLASGDEAIEQELRGVADRYPNRFSVSATFDLALARRMYSAADFMLVPSRFEPCGLTQLIAMRYGAIPVVRETGGLKDTVMNGETGITFTDANTEACQDALERACGLYANHEKFGEIQGRCMTQNWSWAGPVEAYTEAYAKLL